VQLSPPRAGERRIDAVAYQRVHELKAVGRTSQKRVAQETFGVVARVVDQASQRRERESLSEDRRGLDRAPIVRREQIGAGEDDALNGAWQLAVDKVASRPQKLFQKQRIAAGALNAFRGEFLAGREAAGYGFRLGRGERREVDRELKDAGRGRPPARVERIAANARRQDKRGAAMRGSAREDRKLSDGLRVSPVYVLDNHEKRLAARGFLDEARKRKFLAAGAGGGVHRLVEPARLVGLWSLDQIAKIEGIVGRPRLGGRHRCKRLFDLGGQCVAREIEETANKGAKRASSPLDAEIQRPTHVAGEAEFGADRLQFLDKTRLTNAGFAAHDDDRARLPAGDRGERAAALGKLGAAADQRAALGRGFSQSLQAKRREPGHRGL
jgi:hypothetical protein